MIRLVRTAEGGVNPPAGAVARAEGPADPLRDLAAEARRGDGEAERTLLIALGPPVLRVVRGVLGAASADVEDVLQEALLAVHGALPGFRGECKTVHFACRIAIQTAMNARRRAGYRARHTPPTPPEELTELGRDERTPAEIVASARRRAIVRGLLDELPAPQGEVLALHVMLGHSVAETAAMTGAPVNTVRSRLRNALAALRVRVEDDPALLDAVKEAP